MSASVERSVSANRLRTEEKIVNFSPEKLKAPFLLRCGALIIDYIIFIAVPVMSILFARFMGNDGAKLLNSELNNSGWLIAVLIGLTNFLIFPIFSGRSIGKMLTGLQIVKADGHDASFASITMRHLIGYPLTLLTLGLGFLLSAFTKNGRALHDLIGGTVVVYGRKRVLK